MKIKNLIKTTAIFLLCCIMVLPLNAMAYAGNDTANTYDSIYSDFIPAEANEYVEENYTYILEVVAANLPLFDLQSSELENIYIGKPYTIYNIGDNCDSEIYYYPVVNRSNGEIILIINLIGTTTGWSMSIDQNFVIQLNEIDFLNNDYILYSNEDATIAENDTKSVLITGTKNTEIKKFEKIAHSQKIKNIHNSLKQKKKVDAKAVKGGPKEEINASRGYSVNTSTNKVCTLFNSKGQGNLPICWAASIATIVNYVNGSNVSATDVCDALNLGYVGQNISMKKRALDHYGLDFYTIVYEQLSWSNVKANINNRFPVAASLFSEDGSGHGVTVMGYREVLGSRNPRYYITIWNSGLNGGAGGTQVVCYTYEDTSVPYNNKAFIWKYSLY